LWVTGGAKEWAPRPWRVLARGGAAKSFSSTSVAAAGDTERLRSYKKLPKIALFAHYNFAECGVGGGWRARALHACM